MAFCGDGSYLSPVYDQLIRRASADAVADFQNETIPDEDGLGERAEARAREVGIPAPEYEAGGRPLWLVRAFRRIGIEIATHVVLPPDRGAEAYTFGYLSAAWALQHVSGRGLEVPTGGRFGVACVRFRREEARPAAEVLAAAMREAGMVVGLRLDPDLEDMDGDEGQPPEQLLAIDGVGARRTIERGVVEDPRMVEHALRMVRDIAREACGPASG